MVNVTGIDGMATYSYSGFAVIPVALIIGVVFIVMLFCLFKNFRIFLTGIIFLVPLSIIGWISFGISKATGEGSYTPIISFISIVIGIVVCIGLGMLIEEFISKISIDDDKPKVKKK